MKSKLLLLGLVLAGGLRAQDKAPDNWFNLEPSKTLPGVGTEKAYQELLKGKKSTKIIVAVLDSGIDIFHEDLKDKIWTNAKEIAGNGKDDDGNGYVDDVHGWNFIGGKGGKNIDQDNLEVTRLYRELKGKYGKYDGKKKIPKKKQAGYEQYQKVKENYETRKAEADGQLVGVMGFIDAFNKSLALFKEKTGVSNVTAADLAKAKDDANASAEVKRAAGVLGLLINGDSDEAAALKLLGKYKDQVEGSAKYHLNLDFDPRKEIVGDNYADATERSYGNNDVKAVGADHGTHVAGIIAANRNNNLGILGVCDNCEIMPVRCVPDGDERDKDVANAIRYAVDNGAKVINMSFGKNFGTNKAAVDEAVKYAEAKGVLLVHAAGNDAYDADEVDVYPNPKLGDDKSKKFTNWVNVGACSWMGGENLPADFSNYGQTAVDIFAPGVDVYSTTPENHYESFDGTSMASPVFAGCAALLWSYYPNLTVQQVREILLTTGTTYDIDVVKPGTEDEKVRFRSLCVTGKVVNVYEALKKAATMK